MSGKVSLRIESDGTRGGTRLVTDDGREIPVSRIEWSIDADQQRATAVVHLSEVPLHAGMEVESADFVVPALSLEDTPRHRQRAQRRAAATSGRSRAGSGRS